MTGFFIVTDLLFTCHVSLTACAQVVSEQEGTFTYENKTYRAVTREYVSGDRTYSRRVIFVHPKSVSCSAVDDKDCIGAIRQEYQHDF